MRVLELITSPQSEQEFCSLIEQLAADPSRRDRLIGLLREDHPAYDQRGASTIARMRGWILLALARIKLPDAALPFVLEELDTGIDAYLVAAAALALRSRPTPDPAFAPFVVRAIGNIRYRDQHVSVTTYGGYAIGTTGTTAVRELLETLNWLGPQARLIAPEVKLLHDGPTALPNKYRSDVKRVLHAMLTEVGTRDCCQSANGIRELFSSVKIMRTSSTPIDSVAFEDQDGETITFREFFHGRSSIVVFFYTRCDNPLKCSLTITKLARIQELLASEGLSEQINTAGITYDPGFDLPERLRNYGEHRALSFGPKHRLLRAPDGLDAVREHFKLGVNFIESLVNRHRIEVYILDPHGRIAGVFERIQWSEEEVVQRAIEVMRDESY